MKDTTESSQPSFWVLVSSSDPLLTKLQELADLPDGWRFGEGGPPKPATLRTAREIYRRVGTPPLKADAFPGADGSLTLVFYADERCVEIVVARNGKINVSVEEGKGFDFREIKNLSDASMTKAVDEVLLLAENVTRWNSFGFFIHENTIRVQNASAVHASPTLATEQEFRLLMPNAFENTPHRYVGTSNTFIQVS